MLNWQVFMGFHKRLLERIAGLNRAPVHAPLKPFHALRRRTVRERFRTHPAALHSLQSVVPDRSDRAESAFHVAALGQIALLCRFRAHRLRLGDLRGHRFVRPVSNAYRSPQHDCVSDCIREKVTPGHETMGKIQSYRNLRDDVLRYTGKL
jgi:hypothetical protein